MSTILGTELTGRLEGLRAELCTHRNAADSLISGIDKVLRRVRKNPALHTRPSLIESAAKRPGQSNMAMDAPKPKRLRTAIMEHALKRLSEGPYRTPDLLKLLKDDGCEVKGKRPIQTLYGVLHKDMKSANPRVTRSKDGLWQKVQTN